MSMTCAGGSREMRNRRWFVFVAIGLVLLVMVFLPTGEARKSGNGVEVRADNGIMQKGSPAEGLTPYVNQAVAFVETPALRDIKAKLPDELRKLGIVGSDREKNPENTLRVKPPVDPKM